MKKSFKDLVRQMKPLQESQEGKLKGGFSSFGGGSSMIDDAPTANNCNCINPGCGQL